MPGARELRELCQALQITPNKLLFGEDFPFREPRFEDVIADHPEHEIASHGRIIALLRLVTADERQAITTLLRSLALARHGEAKIKAEITEADVFFGVMLAATKLSNTAHEEGKPLSPEAVSEFMAAELEGFMAEKGHTSNQKKLPKK